MDISLAVLCPSLGYFVGCFHTTRDTIPLIRLIVQPIDPTFRYVWIDHSSHCNEIPRAVQTVAPKESFNSETQVSVPLSSAASLIP